MPLSMVRKLTMTTHVRLPILSRMTPSPIISPDTRILITGCGGMLGDSVYAQFKDKCKVTATDIDLNVPWLSHLDVRDKKAVEEMAAQIDPHWIFHLAAHTDVEYCELNPSEAYMTNAIGAENSALVCQKRGIPMVYIGTAGIFDGKQEYYNDYDEPNPLSVYGKAKLGGERAVRDLLSQFYIFRAGWMMGGGPAKDKKFVNKFIKQIKAGKKELSAVDDKLGSPTYTRDFAATIAAVLETGNYGLYHTVGQGDCSRFDVAEEILRLFNLQDRLTLKKVDSSFWQKEYFAPRPRSEKLVTLKLQLRNINIMRHWKETLKEYIGSYDWGLAS